jgi:hypothetical protein
VTGPSEVSRPVWLAHRALCTPSGPLSAHTRQRGGGGRGPFLTYSTILGNCPFCPIYSTIGIHPVMKGYWPIIKISRRHWGRFDMQSVQSIFFFFGFWGEGEREKFLRFSIGGGGPVQVVPSSVCFLFYFLKIFCL